MITESAETRINVCDRFARNEIGFTHSNVYMYKIL